MYSRVEERKRVNIVGKVNDSRFYMWRGVVAMAHADGVVTPHELSFINNYVKEISFSQEQLDIIGYDIANPQSTYDMFSHIDEVQDRKDFFVLARALSWCDGDYAAQEKSIIEHLEQGEGFSQHTELLRESRETMNEIALSQDQWETKEGQARGIFGFISGLKTQSS